MKDTRLIDAAALVATAAFAEGIPLEGVTEREDCVTARRGPLVWVFFEPHAWTRQLIKTIGERAFLVSAMDGDNPQGFSRAAVCLALASRRRVRHRLLKYCVAERIAYRFAGDRRPRMNLDTTQAEKLATAYGTKFHRVGRARHNTKEIEHAEL